MLQPFRDHRGKEICSPTGGPLNTFVRLPREKLLLTSPPRTTLEIQTPNATSTYPGREPVSVHCANGVLYLTNQRLVYLPLSPTPRFQSFSAPILNLQDTHVYAPFFGANAWHGLLKCVPGGGINAQHGVVEVRMTFKEGGAYDFANAYERTKEQLVQQQELANEIGAVGTGDVTLDPLPAYEPRESRRNEGETGEEAPPASLAEGTELEAGPPLGMLEGSRQDTRREGQQRSPGDAPPVQPDEPPPAYSA